MYYASSREFDFKNYELLFVHIDDCRMFENQLVPLNPKYNIECEDGSYKITDNRNYLNVTEKYRLNILALCGRNGVGKSTFLRLLSGRHSHEGTYTTCWIDRNGAIASSNPIDILFRDEPIALNSMIANAGFTPKEMELLKKSHNESDRLVKLETQAYLMAFLV